MALPLPELRRELRHRAGALRRRPLLVGKPPGMPLGGVLECAFEGNDATRGASSATRGSILLPIEAEYFPPLPVGDTPLWAPTRL